MSATLAEEDRLILIERAERVGAAAEQVPAVGAEERLAWYGRLQDAVLDLSNALPTGTEDSEARRLFQFLVELGQAITDDPDATDEKGRVRLARMRMLDVARRLKRRLEHRALDLPDEAARFVFAQVPELTASELAELLGVSTKTIGVWKQGRPVKTNAERVVIVARTLAYLGSSMTPRGFMLWFATEQDALDGRTPLAVLDDGKPADLLALTALARGGRGQLAD